MGQISDSDGEGLIAAFSEEEIQAAVWDCEGQKSPGPDGTNFTFIKEFWDILKSDFIAFLEEFHANEKLVKGSNNSFICLIFKKDNQQRIGDYRLISLIGCMYKVLAKLLANRMREVMSNVISKLQTAFVKNRQILDGVLIANELVEEARKRKRPTLLFKVDFEKAYNSVSWEFLDYMMMRMNFPSKWRRWIRECLATDRISVLVNMSPIGEFSVGRGLRQGDPLSPFLFLIAAEGLSSMFREAERRGIYSGFQLNSLDQGISHLQFADDTLIIGEKSDKNVCVIKAVLQLFELVSGLKVNFHKSLLFG